MLRNPLRAALRALRRASRLRRVHSAPILSRSSTPRHFEANVHPETQKLGSGLSSRLEGNAKVDILASSSSVEKSGFDHSNTASGAASDHSEPSASPEENGRFDLAEPELELEDDSEDEVELPPTLPYAVVPTSPSSRIICPDSGRPARRLALYGIDQVLGEAMARAHPEWMPTMTRMYENGGGPSGSTATVTVPEWEFDNCVVQIPIVMNGGNPFGEAVLWDGDERVEEGAFEVGPVDRWEVEVSDDMEHQMSLDAIPRVFLEE